MTQHTETEETTTLYVKVEPREQFHERGLEQMEQIEDGRREPFDETHVLSFTNFEDLSRIFSETNMELLQIIAEYEPESIRETARCAERDVSDVHRNLTELETLGIIEFEEHGRSKRPTVFYDEIEVTVPLPQSSEDDDSSRVVA